MLEDMKVLLGLEGDTDLDRQLMWICDSARERLRLLLGGIDPPETMNHIIVEAAVIRFNRIGSEGLSAHTVEGESLSFSDGDFNGFHDEIQAFLDSQQTSKGRVRFL